MIQSGHFKWPTNLAVDRDRNETSDDNAMIKFQTIKLFRKWQSTLNVRSTRWFFIDIFLLNEWMNEKMENDPQKLQFSPVFRATLLTTTSIRGKDFEDWHHRDMSYFRKVRLTVKMFQLCFCWYTFHSFLLLDSIYRWSSMEFIDMELRAA